MSKPRPWPDIVSFYRDLAADKPEDPFWKAFSAVGGLASYIADSPLHSALFGWTSMHDLGIQQMDTETFGSPHLRISPQHDGMIEFRYHDTTIKARQWSRQVPPSGVIGRFDAFLDQLHWIARWRPDDGDGS